MLCLFSSFANAQQTREAEAAAEAFAVAVHNAFPSSQASQAVHEEIAASLEAHAKEETWPEEEDDDELEAHMSAAAHERKVSNAGSFHVSIVRLHSELRDPPLAAFPLAAVV